MSNRIARFALFAALGVVIAVLFAWQYGFLSPGGGRPGASGVAQIGGPFTLTDHTGVVRSEQDFRGKLMLIYFGYTYCPDVCPTALSDMALVMDALGDEAVKLRPMFITVDPSRDTPERLKPYVANFHPKLVGLTGSETAVAAAAKAYRVYFAKSNTEAGSGEYLMDHTSIIYLMGPDGRYLTHFSHGVTAEKMAKRIRENLS